MQSPTLVGELKLCRLTYWTGEKSEQGTFKTVRAIVNDSDIKLLKSNKPPKFIEVIIDDGDWMLFPTENINQMIQIYK